MNELAFSVVRYVAEHYADVTSLDDVARRFSVSASTASRYVKETTGTSFSEYINGLRVEFAAHDLITTDRDIADISADNGFSSTSVFSRTFKAAYGMPPREYRKRNKMDTDRQLNRRVRIDVGAAAWTPCSSLGVSLGSIATSGVPGFVDHVLSLIDRMQLKRVRIHNLFSDFVYQRNRQYERRDRPYDGYEFTFIDGLFDELVRRGIMVDVELSNRDWAIRQTFTQNVVSVSQRPAFDSLHQVRQAAMTLARYWKRRYTAGRMRGWSFDLWYDPMLSSIDDYVLLLRDLRAELRDILPECPVGGCALSPSDDRQRFVGFVESLADNHVTPDFVSISSYAHSLFAESRPDGGESDTSARPHATHSLRREIEQARSILDAHGVDCPIRVCSWEPVPSQRNRYNDSSEKAAMMLQELSACSDLPVPITYGALTDFSSLYSDVDTLFFGGTGLAGKDGFPKPAMHAFQFLKGMPKHIVARGDGFVCGYDDDHSYAMLLWNRSGLNQQYTHAKEYELTMQQLKLLYRPERHATYTVELHNMPRNRYLLREYHVDDTAGNGVAAAERHSVDGFVPTEDYRYIAADSLPRHAIRTVVKTDEAVRFQTHLNPHGFALIKLTEL